MKFTWMIHRSFAIWGYFFHKVSVIVSTLFPTLSKTLYTGVVKFPASTLEYVMKSLFQFVVICKMASTQCIRYAVKQMVVGGCHIWAFSRMGKKVHPIFEITSRVRKLLCGQALSWRRRISLMFRLGWNLRMCCRSLKFPCTARDVLGSRAREFSKICIQRLT
jgi:hypothetical protein